MKSIMGSFGRIFVVVAFLMMSPAKAAVPPAPADLQSSWVDGSSSLLTWEDVPEADSFNIYRYETATESWILIASEIGVRMFRETPAGIEPPLQYAVAAVNGDGVGEAAETTITNSGLSDTMIMYYDLDWYPWLKGRTWATLQFAASTVEGVDALLEFGPSVEQMEFLEYRPDYMGFHGFSITNLTPGTQYFFRVTFSEADRLGLSLIRSFYTLAPNVPPQVYDLTASLYEDSGSVSIEPSYSDPDSYSTPTFRVATGASNGTVTLNGSLFWYTPNANFFGTDTFTYAAHDGKDEGAPATVTVTVTPINDAPTANNQSLTIPYNATVGIMLTGKDVEGATLSFGVTSQPANGTLTGTAPYLMFTPNVGWSGTTSFTFVVSDGQRVSAPATVTITVQTTATPPAAPSGLSAQAISNSVIGLWWTDNSNNEDGFKIERQNGSTWVQVGTVGPNVRIFTNSGLSPNRFYTYRVRAFNIRGHSAYSNPATAKTPF